MASDVDDVVDAAQDAEVAVFALHGSVAGEVRPVLPVLRIRTLVVLRVVSLDKAIGVFPDRLHDPWPRIADADVARPGSRRDFAPILVVDDRMDARDSGPCAAGLHR